MPNGFWYAGGDTHVFESAIPSSAFSKGDILTYTSASSLSRIADAFPAGDIAGVALCDSVDSISNVVPYIVPGPDTLFWASLATGNSSAFTVGQECDINFGTGNNRYFVTSSTDSVRAVIVRGPAGVGSVSQSVQSKVLVRLIYNAGNLDIS